MTKNLKKEIKIKDLLKLLEEKNFKEGVKILEETGFKKTESLKSENIINGSLLITNYYKNDDEKVISIILYTKNKYEKHNNEIELNITKIEYGAVATDF